MPRQEQDFHAYPLGERISKAEIIAESIPQGRIRVQKTKGKVREMWGLVSLDGLPFCFKAWPDASGGKIEFLQDGLFSEEKPSNWWVHAPYNPSNFIPPLFTDPIGEADMEYVIGKLKIDMDSLSQQEQRYQEFNRKYRNDPFLRGAFDAAVSLACDEKMQEIKGS